MATWEPTFVTVLGGSETDRASLVRGLIAALRSEGVSATSLQSYGARFWEMAVVFVEGFPATTLPRIVLAAAGEPTPRQALTGGEVISVVDPVVLGARSEVRASVVDAIARRKTLGEQSAQEQRGESAEWHKVRGA